MSLVDWSRSLLVVPSHYGEVKPHHLVVGYTFLRALTSTSAYRKLSKTIFNYLSKFSEACIPLIHMGLIPDLVIRFGIRVQLYDHLNILKGEDAELEVRQKMDTVKKLSTMPIAIETQAANDQHYEVPAKFFDLCLGPRKKYSSGYWPTPSTTFEESEIAMLDKYCENAKVQDGMKIVDLGCGWGSLTLHLAEKYPNAKITSISNSNSQCEYIYATAKKRGYNVDNITVITCNVSDDKGGLDVVKDNDLVMTVEMCVV
jgi:cyclopropane-fatty-acyl-phospholipid synthase